jgi:hypothetical protein
VSGLSRPLRRVRTVPACFVSKSVSTLSVTDRGMIESGRDTAMGFLRRRSVIRCGIMYDLNIGSYQPCRIRTHRRKVDELGNPRTMSNLLKRVHTRPRKSLPHVRASGALRCRPMLTTVSVL